jgi:TPR repeat protein
MGWLRLDFCLLLIGMGLAMSASALAVAPEGGSGGSSPAAIGAILKVTQERAAAGDANAQNLLGEMYQKGASVPRSEVEAARWFRLAANQGNAEAQNNLGAIFGRGQVVPRDLVIADMLFNLSAAQGDAGGVRNRDLAERHMSGEEIARARGLAADWKPASTPFTLPTH